jgi:NAD(P)-dependent dehydrogenase (short-subunit alcohol dehydrogenase family)
VSEQRGDQAELSSLFRLDGKRALVTGGYGGIGSVTSELLAEFGAAVAIAGRSIDKARELADRLSEGGARASGHRVDLADPASARELVAEVAGELGGIDVLVNLAGIEVAGPATDFPEDQWEMVMDINLGGAFWLTQAVGRVMLEAGEGGRIIHLSSTRSVAGSRRPLAAYGASKAGLNMLIKQLATEWGAHGITVNGVAPGFVPTPMMQQAAQDEKFVGMLLSRIPMGRFGEPVEMASAILYLALPAASFITGQVLFVDGGVTASS